MPTLWLTYAWKDNEQQDVDFVVQRLQEEGVTVRLDRTQLLAGRRLWEQISDGITDPKLDGWAIFATMNSLASEPCLEEIAYALDRALRNRGPSFPIIGIFPAPMNREFIPSALATRLYVTLKDLHWAARVADGLNGVSTQRTPSVGSFQFYSYHDGTHWVYEMRPREGVWQPARVIVQQQSMKFCFPPFVTAPGRPEFRPAFFNNTLLGPMQAEGQTWEGWAVEEQVDATKSLYLRTRQPLSHIGFSTGLVTPNVRIIEVPTS